MVNLDGGFVLSKSIFQLTEKESFREKWDEELVKQLELYLL